MKNKVYVVLVTEKFPKLQKKIKTLKQLDERKNRQTEHRKWETLYKNSTLQQVL